MAFISQQVCENSTAHGDSTIKYSDQETGYGAELHCSELYCAELSAVISLRRAERTHSATSEAITTNTIVHTI